MKTLVILAVAAVLSGCATADFFVNRVSCTVGGVNAFSNSMYGPVGITSKVAQEDADAICKKPVLAKP